MSRLENNRYAVGFQLTSRMSRQVLPPSTKPLHLPIYPFHPLQQWHTVASRVPKRFTRSSFCKMPYKGLPFLTRRSADVLICPPFLDNVHFLTSLPSVSLLLRNANVYGNTPARARARNGVPWSHLDGMSRAVRLKEERARFILRLCTSTRVLFLGRVPSRSSSVSPHFRE